MSNVPAITEITDTARPEFVRGAVINVSGVPYLVTGPASLPATYLTLRLPDLGCAMISAAAADLEHHGTVLEEGVLVVVEQAVHTASAARDDLETFKRSVRSVAIDYARRYDWCDVVSSALEELGLPAAEQDYESDVEVRLSFPVKVRARSIDGAIAEVDREYLIDRLHAMDRADLYQAIDDHTTGTWDRSEDD